MIGQSRLTLEKTEGWGNQDTLATFGTQDAGPRQTKLKKHNTEKKMSNTRPHQNSEVNQSNQWPSQCVFLVLLFKEYRSTAV